MTSVSTRKLERDLRDLRQWRRALAVAQAWSSNRQKREQLTRQIIDIDKRIAFLEERWMLRFPPRLLNKEERRAYIEALVVDRDAAVDVRRR